MVVAAHLLPTLQLEKYLPPGKYFLNWFFQKKYLNPTYDALFIDFFLAIAFIYIRYCIGECKKKLFSPN